MPISGLTQAQIQDRKNSGLINSYKPPSSRSYASIIQENLFNFINIVLFVIAIMLVFIGRASDAIIYIGVVLLNSVISIFQEVKAKITLDKITLLTTPKAKVIRDGNEQSINLSEIVLDDILLIKTGDLIPVDGKILEGHAQIDESLLTGESDLIDKKVQDELKSGTYVNKGNCYFQATKVGINTTINQISIGVKRYKHNQTPIQNEVNLTVRILFVISSVFAVLIFLGQFFSNIPFVESLPIAAVIAGIIPNSLFVMINLAYALGSVRILKKGVLVQQLNAIESLSHVEILCLDKTGTLTTNQILFENIIPLKNSKQETLQELADFAATTNQSTQTTQAIIDSLSAKKLSVIDEVQFSSMYKWSGFSFKQDQNEGTYILGAPEIIYNNKDLDQTIQAYQDRGYRVLLLLKSDKILNLYKNNTPTIPQETLPYCIAIFKNELRPDAESTIRQFQEAGVKIKIISGDNPSTVSALAKQAGFHTNSVPISGLDLENLPPSKFRDIAINNSIFGRITPSQKESIVDILKTEGYYVAMVGDGINDALSLKKANLGIAMESGTQVTRSVADILLLNNSFAGLTDGIFEGQRIKNSIKNTFKIYITRVGYLFLTMLAISIINLPFPFTIKQNSLISLITTGIPGIGLTIWATAGIPDKDKLLRSSLGFIISASITLSIFAITLFLGYGYFLSIQPQTLGNLNNDYALNTVIVENRDKIQSILTIFIILAGLTISIYTQTTKKITSYRNFCLAVVTAIGFLILVFTSADFRAFWDLTVPSTLEAGIILITFVIWFITLKIIWQYRLTEKFFNLD